MFFAWLSVNPRIIQDFYKTVRKTAFIQA